MTLAASATSGLDVSFSVISEPAILDGNVLTLTGLGTVTVRASQAGNDAFNPATEVEQSFEVHRAFDNWLMAHFTEAELLEPAISGGGADPDMDGLPNDVEYALGLNPQAPSSLFTGDHSLSINEAGDSLVLRFSRNPDAFDATIAIEESFDLAFWTSVATSVDGAAFQSTQGYTVSESSGEGVLNVELIGLFTSPATRFQRIIVVR